MRRPLNRAQLAQKEKEAAEEAAFHDSMNPVDPRICLTCGHRMDDHIMWECYICRCKNPKAA